jgi:hypothetical protein
MPSDTGLSYSDDIFRIMVHFDLEVTVYVNNRQIKKNATKCYKYVHFFKTVSCSNVVMGEKNPQAFCSFYKKFFKLGFLCAVLVFR